MTIFVHLLIRSVIQKVAIVTLNIIFSVLILAIVHQILWTKYNIIVQKVKMHIRISGNEIAVQLAIEGTTGNKLVHVAHTIHYWLNIIMTSERQGEICNLQTYINKGHNKHELRTTKIEFTYIDNEHIHQSHQTTFRNPHAYLMQKSHKP